MCKQLTESGSAFVEKFGAAWDGALEDFRAEWRRTRRWSVPVLAAALILAMPGFAVVGALGQSQFGIFAPHDDTEGWKRFVWKHHGDALKECVARAAGSKQRAPCYFEVDWP